MCVDDAEIPKRPREVGFEDTTFDDASVGNVGEEFRKRRLDASNDASSSSRGRIQRVTNLKMPKLSLKLIDIRNLTVCFLRTKY